MKKKITDWFDYQKLNQKKYGFIFLILIALAFVVSDWSIYYFSFAEIIFISIMPILLFVGQLQVKKKQLILILILMCIFSVSFLLNLVINKEDFYFRLATQASIKVAFYMFIVAIFLNYIKRNQYEELFLTINNIFAVIIILIGLYIVFSIYNDHEYPYKLLWKFTREDYKSYYFNGNSNFIE